MSERQSDKALQEFLSEAQEIIESLNRDLLALDEQRAAGKYDPEIVNDAFRAVHSLKGLSGLFGITPMTNLSHTLETLLDSLRLGRVAVTPQILDLLFETVEIYGQLIADTSAGRQPDMGRVEDYLSRLDKAASAKPGSEAGQSTAEYDLDPGILSVLTEYEEHRLRQNIQAGRTLFRIHVAFDLMTIDKGLEDLKVRLKPVGEVITYLPSSESADDNKIDLDVLVGSDLAAAAIQDVIAGIDVTVTPVARKEVAQAASDKGGPQVGTRAVAPPAITPSVISAAPVAVPVPIVPEPQAPSDARAPLGGASRAEVVRPHAHAGDEQPHGDEEERPSSLKSVSQTVRVDIRKLDYLMNIVGELALARAGIVTVLEELRQQRDMSDLARNLYRESRALERKLNELQSGILEVRMVPLGQIFDKLSRVVRKISRESGKDIRFQISGADTELDKLIVEELSDPLMHIIRNSIDHGIEEVDARRRAGKPDHGTISVSAHQKGNHVVIDVVDDGGGFDEERILETALRKKLIDTAAAAEITRRDLFNLVFLPGFSTKEQATELSGRGVGMDVVKTNIAKLSGIIDLNSSRGKGTQISITLPITLAIIQALVIRVVGRTYAVPLNSVLESLTVTPSDIRTIEGREVITVRGQTLALLRLENVFCLGRDADSPQDRTYVVVVGLAQHRLGLVVDELTGQQDIVIKSLGKALAQIPGIAGATELGGQQTVLVIDVAALVEETLRVGVSEAA
ncbi:MAG: chemotaxis protein CheA [Deltaproteobacteria bacterium]|nr:chemotaxis protein CheA [Deltaproteobacteria bacterium]